ncbi:MAG TPA: DUF4424 family protein [Rhizomicrobium sp.]|nr:DUF4424 family protein [Rhizomicrobium sp.]
MNRILCWALTVSFCVFSTSQILADDSSAALSAGGLVLTKSADIRMAAEDLRISPDAVSIRYEFVNDSGRDVDTIVAFPLPDIDTWNFYEEPIGRTTNDPLNFVGFKVSAGGTTLPVRVEQRAFYNGKDVTQTLKSLDVPVNPLLGGNLQKLDKLAPEKKRMLEKAGLAEADAPDQEHPKWTVRTRFYWMQHFPAGKKVVITHDYKPVTGQAFFTDYDLKEKPGSGNDHWQQKYCMDDATLAKAATMLAARKTAKQNEGMLNASSTAFVLKTANNWKGGIGRFHLTIDKLKPENVLSLCWNGDLKKSGPHAFEFTRAHFRPSRDLEFLVLQ